MSAPFTTAEARQRGVGRGVLRGSLVRREFVGVYVPAKREPSWTCSVAAARRVLPADARLDGTTALRSYGVELGGEWPLRFVTAHRHQVRRAGLRVRRVNTLRVGEPADTGAANAPQPAGPAIAPELAWVSAGRELDMVEMVSAGDWLVRLAYATPASLVEAARCARGRGVVSSRRAADLVREGVDSVRETQLRLCLALAGLPEPEVNPVMFDGERRIGRVDLLFRTWRVVVEYEGDQHRTQRRQWNVDIRRHEQLRDAGYVVVRITAERMRHPRTVVTVVDRALREAGYDGSRPTFDAEWHRLFPSAR